MSSILFQCGTSLSELVKRESAKMAQTARKRIAKRFGARIDPDDVVQSAWVTFHAKARNGELSVESYDDCAKALSGIVHYVVLQQMEHASHGKRSVSYEQYKCGECEGEHNQPVPDIGPEAAMVREFLSLLTAEERGVLEALSAGYSTDDIGRLQGRDGKMIRRVRQRIAEKYTKMSA